ncbi:hypothetical protein CI109_104604 [Kwoniella shandongensis]|uniref:SAGA-associated factor 11 n=1 Tax=Kwoniella shandongensis TaxID=1734106 RepID=A0A5M6BX73_9TREE|nr:uncharacterized protein CI109_004770 [Kwoniella shandongensis]KAA5526770.1 hypothetical protein CI109_004770 [Kwoniella shandongensis]
MGDRATEIRQAAKAVLDEMIGDMILSTAMAAHREIKRGRVICGTCGTRCRAHLPLQSLSSTAASSSSSNTLQLPDTNAAPSASTTRTASPQPSLLEGTNGGSGPGRSGGYPIGPERGTGGATGIGSGSGRVDGSGNAFFDCLVCGRSISSNRYAPHLSSCLGLNGSTRRGAARSAAVKARLGNNDRSSPSPYLAGQSAASDNGDWGSDGDSVSGSKKKKALNGSNSAKRGRSPSKVPIPKKSKLGSATSSATPTPTFQRQALPPSKLGRPPTNRSITTQESSPAFSPAKSVISIASSDAETEIGGGGGMTGAKTLPGMGGGMNVAEVVPGDESSEGADDDY